VPKGTILFVVLAMLLTLSGCGGGDDSTLSKEEYTQQLKLVCNEGEQARQTLIQNIARDYYENHAQRPTDQYQAKNVLKLINTYQETTAKIADIGLPEGNEEQVEKFIRTREEAAAKIEASPLGTRDNLQTLLERPEEEAEALGVGTCDS
jgi:hypothetical protein